MFQITTKDQNDRNRLFNEMKENFGSLIRDMADDLHIIAKQLKSDSEQQSMQNNSLNEIAGELIDTPVNDSEQNNDHISNAVDHTNDLSTMGNSEILQIGCSDDSSQQTVRKLNEAAKEKLLAESSLDESDDTILSLPQIGQRIKKPLRKRKVKKQYIANDSPKYTSSSNSSSECQENHQTKSQTLSKQNIMCNSSKTASNGLTKDLQSLEADSANLGVEISNGIELKSQPESVVSSDHYMTTNETVLQSSALSPASEMDSDSNDAMHTDEDDDDDIRR